jgi:hypothetical protein
LCINDLIYKPTIKDTQPKEDIMKKRISLLVSTLALVALAGAANAAGTTRFAVQDAGGADKAVIQDNGFVGVGTTSPATSIHAHISAAAPGTALYSAATGITASHQDNSAGADFVVADGTATAGFRGNVRGVRARGTLAAPTAPIAEDLIFSVIAGVYDGTAIRNNADINFTVDGAVSTGVAPVRIGLRTRTGGAGAYFERLTVKNDGKVGIATTAPTALFDVNSDTIRLRTAKTPATSAATCNQGDISWDANFTYVCVAANSWKRSALSAF